MNNSQFQRAALSYEMAAAMGQRTITVDHELLKTFGYALRRLASHLGDAAEEELWRIPLGYLKRFGFFAVSAPVPFNLSDLVNGPILAAISHKLPIYQKVDPVAATLLGQATALAARLGVLSENPLLASLTAAFPKGIGRAFVLLNRSHLVPAAEKLLKTNSKTSAATVVTQNQLKGDIYAERLVIVGASSWFPAFVVQAPRAKEIVILRYSWLREQRQETSLFIDGWPNSREPSEESNIVANTSSRWDSEDDIQESELISPIDWAQIHSTAIGRFQGHDIEDVAARLAMLEGDFAVFLDDDSGASVLTIDPDAGEKQERVVRLGLSLLKAEMFIILRSSGGSDYIVTMADKLMGAAGASCRAQQQDWKDRLKKLVLRSSLLEVSVKLLDAGSTARAHETNVRNWISARNIRPQSKEDFGAIMKVIEAPEKTEEYWRSMDYIARNHQRAGQQIRRLLIRKLHAMDLTDLRRLGRLDFALPDAGAGTLTAFRIIAIEPKTRMVPAGQLNHPFHYGGAYGADATI